MQEIRNRSEYNRALINRGSITLWLDEETINDWKNWIRPQGTSGRNGTYGDAAILCAAGVRSVFKLTLRSTRGFLESLLFLLDLDLPCSSFSTIGKRSKKLKIELPVSSKSGSMDLVIDSTGLKVFGEGEWKARTHGPGKRRVWRKLHLAVDPKTHEVVVAELTDSSTHDSESAERLLQDVAGHVAKVFADGAYDNVRARKAIALAGGQSVVPPRSGAALKVDDLRLGDIERNAAIRSRW